MPYDDFLHDDNNSFISTDKKGLSEIKRSDKMYTKEIKSVSLFSEKGELKTKRQVIESYGSAGMGSYIRNAVSGHRTSFIVGSKDEDLFFTVIDARGLLKGQPQFLFYDSPEQYENHSFNKLSRETKEQWHKKYMLATKV